MKYIPLLLLLLLASSKLFAQADDGDAAPTVMDPEPELTDSMKTVLHSKWVLEMQGLMLKHAADTAVMKEIASAFANNAWDQLTTGHYTEAVNMVQLGLKAAPKVTWGITNLALGYLLQGDWKQAKKLYRKWKNVPWNTSGSGNTRPAGTTFNVVFLQDLDELEKNYHITHPDFTKARALLQD